MTDTPVLTSQATQQEVADIVASFKGGQSIDGLMLLDAADKIDDMVAQGALITKPLILGDDLLFVQPDGTIIGLLDGAKAEFALTAANLTIPSENIVAVALQQGAWATVADAVEIDLAVVATTNLPGQGGSGEEIPVLPGDPLNGLPISPLLPPTDFTFPELRDRDVGADEGGLGEANILISADDISLIEIDAALGLRFSDFIRITAGGAGDGEEIANVTIRLPGLPLGTTATGGSFTSDGTTQTFVFSGTGAEFDALVLNFPADFSTEMRSDVASGDLNGTLTATSSFLGDPVSIGFPVRVEPEGDLEFVGSGGARQPETDAPVVFILSEALTPRASDADGSESVTSVSLELNGLPAGAEISTDGGVTFGPVGSDYTFTGTLAEYEQVQLRLPADFSTTNPAAPIEGILQATTDEGADERGRFELIVDATPDIVLTPATVTGTEDGNGADGSGVTVDLNLDTGITIEDADGSEADTTVEIVFADLPPGTTFSQPNASTTPGIWSGTLAQAEELSLTFPGDFSGTISSVITATNIEGSATTTQDIVIAPAPDVDTATPDLIAAETDAPLVIAPSDTWVITISDTDPATPREELETVTLTLNDLPPGVLVQNVPPGTFTYDAAAGGAFSFTGTPGEYALLRFVFPTDYSTQNIGLPGNALTGTILGVSSEGSGTTEPVRLIITAEGDAEMRVLPLAPLVESEAPLVVRLGTVLAPQITDADGSESVDSIAVTITGLPSIDFDLSDAVGFPAGSVALVTEADGSQTLTAVFASIADFNAATLNLPADFSTENRSDLGGATTLPIAVTAILTTDEDADLGVDGPNDGQVEATAFVTVAAVDDINLTIPIEITAEEDDGVINNADGVRVPMQISIAITDDDGSETAVPGSPFSATVRIEFADLPAGATLTTGTLTGAIWTGTVAEANALAIDFPGNYAGVVLANVNVTTPEGSVTRPTAIVVTPTPDVDISGTVTGVETDADLELVLSDFITLAITDVDETLVSLDFVLPGLPVGTQALDAAGVPVGTFTSDGSGTVVFEFSSTAEPTVDPADIRLVFPADFSTESPDIPLAATLTVTTEQAGIVNAPVTGTIDVVISPEGDVRIDVVGTAALQETDAPVDFKPSDYLLPVPTDADGSETIELIGVTFNRLPAGAEFSTDGTTFSAAPFDLGFFGTLAEYNALIVRLPADFSTESPAFVLTGTVIATTNEFGTASGTFDVSVAAEGDLTIVGTGTLSLTENDAPGIVDLDGTSEAPLAFRLADAATGVASDADGSETITAVTVALSDLPTGARLSLDGGVTYGAPLAAGGLTLNLTSIAAFEDVFIRLPDDFSTQRAEGAITGTLTFVTDESVLNAEALNTPGGGAFSQAITIDVAAEGDVLITGRDPVVAEDTGTPINLGLAAAITDVDGSEVFTSLTVTFDGLPTVGNTVLSDGTVLSGRPGGNVWTGSALGDLGGLSIASFPEHFSGIVTMTTNVVTNETGPAGQSATFVLQVTPVAEPVITLTVDATETAVTEVAAGQFSVKEDTSFLLQIDASTPDADGSESLTQVTVENMPAGWLRSGDGAVDLALFETGRGDIASAQITGNVLTITLNPGVTSFDAGLRVTPLADSDLDVRTLTGGELRATVTSVDTAAGLASDTEFARDAVDVDVDAVADDLDLAVNNRTATENLEGARLLDAGITGLALTDTDGSETFDAVTFAITVDTLSDGFDPANPADLALDFGGRDSFVNITQRDTVPGDNVVRYTLERPDGVSDGDFASAVTAMRLVFAQNFSGRATLDGSVSWQDTESTDAEADLSDNFRSEPFRTVLTVTPIAEAELDAGVFVLNGDFTSDATNAVGSVVRALGSSGAPASVVNPDTLTLNESTADASGFGQVEAFLRLGASTRDTDGSEELTTLVVSNVPSSWIGISETTTNVVLDQSMFFSLDGTGPIAASEFDKLDSASFNAATGQLTLTFVPGVTAFAGSVAIYPALYEDYDVDRAPGDRFSDDGNFFAADLNFALTTTDGNTVTTATRNADLTVDVDVDPINNEAVVLSFPVGNEGAVDAAGGVLQFGFLPMIADMDGSETIVSTVLRDVPNYLTVFAPNPADPGGPKIPALLTRINGDGTLNWSLNRQQWEGIEFRGVPEHFSGELDIDVAIVTREANGGTNVTTLTDVKITVDPVVDGGDPSERFSTLEDTAVQVVLDGNIIDRTPESPEVIRDAFTIFDVEPDSEGRLPQFFDGVPVQTGTTAAGDPIYANLISPNASGGYDITAAQSGNLFVLPGRDSNEDVVFKVRVTYEETTDPTQTVDEVGTVVISVKGVADTPTVDGQDPDPAATPGGIDKALIDAVYLPGDVVDGVANADRVYAYAGFDNAPFQLTQRISDAALQTDYTTVADPFTAADPLSGVRNEITFADGAPDGSETLYYIITDIPAGLRFLGGSPVDASGGSYLVTEADLANLTVVSGGVSDVTYYDLKLNSFVLENDVDLSTVPSVGPGVSVDDVLAAIDGLTGGSLTTTDLTLVVLPNGGPGTGMTCPPEQMLPIPELSFVGDAFEDTANELQIAITAEAPFWSSIADLATLPNGVVGDFGFGLTLPAGATLTSTTPGAVVFDPITGQYGIDFSKLGVDPSNPLLTAGTVTYTPPPNQSSPVNPFAPSETFGTADPYDALADIRTTSVLNNFSCNDFSSATGILPLFVAPVADGPQIAIGAPATVLEDTLFDADITISGEDGGERLTGDVIVAINGDPGARLFGPGGEIAPDAGTGATPTYTLSPGDIAGLQVLPTEHFSGDIELVITATSEDVDGSTASSTSTRTVTIEPVADTPEFVYSTDTTPTDTGLPLVTEVAGAPPIVTIAEDTVGVFGDILPVAGTPDQDGSETASAVIGSALNPLPDYVVLGGVSGIIENGDGTFTVPASQLSLLTIGLVDEHARTPDSEDPDILAEIIVDIEINTLELGNSDETSGATQFILRVLPDADKPTVDVEITPGGGVEDDGTAYVVSLAGTTPDVHEEISFQLTVPAGSAVFLDGVAVTIAADGTATIPGSADSAFTGTGAGFVAAGIVTFVPPADFAGEVEIAVVAISTDFSATYAYTDTENSDVADLSLAIAVSPDLTVAVTDTTVVLPETDAVVVFNPASNVTLAVSDVDGSETIDSVTFELVGVPAGTTYSSGGAEIPASGTLVFTGTAAEFAALQITLPADFATNGALLDASVRATTNEGGDVTDIFTVEVPGELDATVSATPADLAQIEGSDLTVPLGIDAAVTDTQASPSETLEEVVVTFDAALPVGTTASDGVLSADRQSLTFARSALSPAEFALAIAALALTVPASFAGDITGVVALTTNHGTTPESGFALNVNARPDVTGVVEVLDVFDRETTLTFAELTAATTDTTALSVENITSPDPLVEITVVGTDVTIRVPAGYVGTPLLEYDIVDSGPVPARSTATASIEFDTMQMQDSGTAVTGPDGVTRALMTDVTGDAALETVAKGTAGDDLVDWDAADRPYDGVTEFQMLDGSDFVDLQGASTGFIVDGGAGNDILIGSSGDDVLRGGADDDVLTGGAGFDELFGGAGNDIFVLASGPVTIADSIGDYETGDRIDLSEQPTGVDDITTLASYDNVTGALTFNGSAAFNVQSTGGAIPAQVEVMFEDSAGAAQTAVI